MSQSASQPEKLRKQSKNTHEQKMVMQITTGLTDALTKQSFLQFMQA